MCVHACSVTQVISNPATSWIIAHQASLCMGFPGKNTSPEDRPNLGIECASPAWQVEWHH